jgi:NitT/TauT family transport system substrate-binding protein
MPSRRIAAVLAALLALGAAPSLAADKMKVASSLRGFWDTTMIEFGQQRGFFAAEGIEFDLLWTDGGSDILQAVNSGSVDVGIGTGVMGVIGAWTKNAPLEIVGNEFVGSSDLYYFVPADSPVKSFKDLDGKTVAVARLGSSSESVGGMLANQAGVKVKFVPAGGPPATLTQVMTKQLDAGWGVFPVFMDQIEAGKIRIVALGKDAPGISAQTTRVNIAAKAFVDNRPDVLRRFQRAYVKTIEHAYASDDIPKQWAEMNKMSLDLAKKVVAENFPKHLILPTSVGPVDLSVEEAVRNKFIARALTDEEVKKLFSKVAEANR